MKLVHSGRNGRQNSNSASSASPSAGQVSHLALGTCLSLLGPRNWDASTLRGHLNPTVMWKRWEEFAWKSQLSHSPQTREHQDAACWASDVPRRMRECCCWAPQWQSMISTSPKSPTVRSDDTDARSCCIRHPGSLDITDPSIPLITGILMELICPHALTPPSQDKWTRRPTDVIQQWRWCTVL